VNRLSVDEVRARALRVRLVLSDNDGVLTDGGVYYSESGESLKRYSIRDGMGVVRLRAAGIETAIITRERKGLIAARAEKLGARLYDGVHEKLAHLPLVLSQYGLSVQQVAYIGDDVNDLGIMERIGDEGLTGAPLDAMPEVARMAHYHCSATGGHGAFRDFAEWILRAAGKT
jgi:3-deoxy-D-manno-octulosonate 8-phosphate phosphatase (KDO 8-P phosphatase)